jgi:hypothetical protein
VEQQVERPRNERKLDMWRLLANVFIADMVNLTRFIGLHFTHRGTTTQRSQMGLMDKRMGLKQMVQEDRLDLIPFNAQFRRSNRSPEF